MIMVDLQQNTQGKKISSKQDLTENNLIKGIVGAKGDYIDNITATRQCSLSPEMSGTENPGGLAGKIIPYLKSIREPLADYQEKKGISKTQNYTFFALVSTVAQYIYTVLVSLVQMVYNLFPILDAFLLILRFILDKAIECLQAKNTDKYIKGAIFFFECIAIILMIVVISGLILAPLTVLFTHMFNKVWNALFS